MRKITVLAVSGAFVLAASTSAFADSKSAAEFLLKTCLPAMDDMSNVEAMAREGNWIAKPVLRPTNSVERSRSMWDVIKSEETFRVKAWINHYEQRDLNTCF